MIQIQFDQKLANPIKARLTALTGVLSTEFSTDIVDK